MKVVLVTVESAEGTSKGEGEEGAGCMPLRRNCEAPPELSSALTDYSESALMDAVPQLTAVL